MKPGVRVGHGGMEGYSPRLALSLHSASQSLVRGQEEGTQLPQESAQAVSRTLEAEVEILIPQRKKPTARIPSQGLPSGADS